MGVRAFVVAGVWRDTPRENVVCPRFSAEPVGNPTAEFAAFFRKEVDKFAKIIKVSGAKPDS